MSYRRVFALCTRLLRGEVLELVDAQGRRWRATARELVALPGGGAVVRGCAYDVAAACVGKGLERW